MFKYKKKESIEKTHESRLNQTNRWGHNLPKSNVIRD